jgi:hypothetical protein
MFSAYIFFYFYLFQGLAFVCSEPFSASAYPDVRYLDLSDCGMTLDDLTLNRYLVHVRVRRCNISMLPSITLPNLRALDLSDNLLSELSLAAFGPELSLTSKTFFLIEY